MSIKIGTDIEFLATIRGIPVASTDVLMDDIEGSKDFPIRMENAVIHRDNIFLEVADIKPASTAEEFSHNVRLALRDAYKHIKAYDAKPMWVPSIHATPRMLSHPESETFGCMPDYNCWTGEVNVFGDPQEFRSAGGHIHVSYDGCNDELPEVAVKACDAIPGLLSVAYDKDGVERKKLLYGRAGAYRPKPYGIEYRVPSNWWCKKHSTRIMMFEWVHAAITNRHELSRRTEGMEDAIQLAINTGDISLSNELLTTMRIDEFARVA